MVAAKGTVGTDLGRVLRAATATNSTTDFRNTGAQAGHLVTQAKLWVSVVILFPAFPGPFFSLMPRSQFRHYFLRVPQDGLGL